MNDLEISIIREVLRRADNGREGYTLGRIYVNNVFYGMTLEDEDRRLEEGNSKIYGTTAMPLGRYKLSLYNSPRHGEVPLFHDVPGFTYTEMHGANTAEQLKGCVGVGKVRTDNGVANCAYVLGRIIQAMHRAEDEGRDVVCTISRAEA